MSLGVITTPGLILGKYSNINKGKPDANPCKMLLLFKFVNIFYFLPYLFNPNAAAILSPP